jgi:hypothetical protein
MQIKGGLYPCLKKVIHEYLEKLDEEDIHFLIQIITIMRYHLKKKTGKR